MGQSRLARIEMLRPSGCCAAVAPCIKKPLLSRHLESDLLVDRGAEPKACDARKQRSMFMDLLLSWISGVLGVMNFLPVSSSRVHAAQGVEAGRSHGWAMMFRSSIIDAGKALNADPIRSLCHRVRIAAGHNADDRWIS
jgi:hypothetical protein